VRQEAGIAVSYGLPYGKAITAITLAPARAFGVDKDRGAIAAGKRADLVMWSGDPLETRTLCEQVWIAGVAQDMRTRHKELGERYRKRNAAR
jgi:imidazolonepropionase-like amidohydrolase